MARIQVSDWGFKAAPVSFLLTRLGTPNVPLNFETPSKVVLDPKITQIVFKTSNSSGVMVPARRTISEEAPIVSCSFPTVTPEITGLLTGKRIVSGGSRTTMYVLNNVLPSTNTIAAVSAGQAGFNTVADNLGAIAAVIRNGVSIPLTLVTPFSTFNHASTTDSFAVGASGAVKLSNNLVASGEAICVAIPEIVSVNNLYSSGTSTDKYSMQVDFLDLNSRMTRMTFDSVSPALDKPVDPSQTPVQIDFNVDFLSGCSAYSLDWTNLTKSC
jgi:hypothetical protein